MAYVSHGRSSGFNYGKYFIYRAFASVSQIAERIVLSVRLRKTAKALSELSADQLKDIGLDSGDVASMRSLGAEQAIWSLHAARKRAGRL